MQISSGVADRNSEDEFATQLRVLLDAGAGIVQVRTGELTRATLATRKILLADGCNYYEWDVVNGVRTFDLSNFNRTDVAGDDIIDLSQALSQPISALYAAFGSTLDDDATESAGEAGEGEFDVFVYVAPHYFLEHNNPTLVHHITQAAHVLPATRTRIVLITNDAPLPSDLADLTASVRFDPPGRKELRGCLDDILGGIAEGALKRITKHEKNSICDLGAGMSQAAFEMYVSKSITSSYGLAGDGKVTSSDISAGVNEGKTEVVNSNDLLELYPTTDMSDVGGMENLKEWICKRVNCFTDKAKEFGVETPKGIVLVGLPGNGKSLAAKAIACEFKVPLIRLDFGRVFNSLVGASEERMRTALRMLETCSPCVVLADEADKGLGGVGGSGDSGTSSRVLGTFLTWMQENKSPVFVIMTANNVEALPPELLRKGRFDAIYSAGLPHEDERMEILKIHLRKRDKLGDFKKADLRRLVQASKGYVGAEIESAIKDGIVEAFSVGEELTAKHVWDALGAMVPLSKSHAETIQKMTLWAKNNATPVSKTMEPSDLDNISSIDAGKRNVRTRGKTEH